MQNINPFIWYNAEAAEAADLYTSLFTKAKNLTMARYSDAGPGPKGSVMVVEIELAGTRINLLNGGPTYKPNPSISFFVNCETEEEIHRLWDGLSDGGKLMMPLEKYPWSDLYGWIEDKYGVSWQLNLTRTPQAVSPAFLFSGSAQGRASEAIEFWTSEFPNSSVVSIERYQPGEHGPEGQIKYSSFKLNGQNFVAMDAGGPMDIPFTPGVSLLINCQDQTEVDRFWNDLSEGGRTDRCGWLQDRFGVSWQVVPTTLGKLMSSGDAKRSQNVMSAMLKMDKLNIRALEDAYELA